MDAVIVLLLGSCFNSVRRIPSRLSDINCIKCSQTRVLYKYVYNCRFHPLFVSVVPLNRNFGPMSAVPDADMLSRTSAAAAASLVGKTHICGPALSLKIDAIDGRARALTMQLPHGPLRTPVFMPVGTHGTVKGLTSLEMQIPPLDFDIILSNTYHLGCRPGGEILAQQGGLHSFMELPRNILTDSGGFQMVSLLKLAKITEEGVEFASPVDGSRMMLTPEMSMALQNQIGSDVMMALDDVVDSKTVDDERFKVNLEICLHHRGYRSA